MRTAKKAEFLSTANECLREALRNFATGQKWRLMKAAHRHDFGECLLLGLSRRPNDACASLEARLSLFHIYLSR